MDEPKDDGVTPVGEPLHITNEFTAVAIRKAHTRNGERLEIVTIRTGERILLDAMQLEVITTLTPDTFNELFARDLGSYDDGRS
jgi:hypothetical protein